MSEEVNFAEQQTKAEKTLGTMLDYLGLEGSIHGEAKDGNIVLKITSSEAGRIIGRSGQTLESLQYLLNLVMFKGQQDAPRIFLDIDGYARGNKTGHDRGGEEEGFRRERSEGGRRPRAERSSATEEELRQQALDAAKEVKRWGEPVTLPSMNAHDRRIIHVTLQDDPELTTASEGEGAMKKVVISIKKD